MVVWMLETYPEAKNSPLILVRRCQQSVFWTEHEVLPSLFLPFLLLLKQSHNKIPEVVCCIHVPCSSFETPTFSLIYWGDQNEYLSSGRLNHAVMSAGSLRIKFSKKSSSVHPSRCRAAVLELLHLSPWLSWEAISLRSHIMAALLMLSALSCCQMLCREPTHLHLVASFGNKNAQVYCLLHF